VKRILALACLWASAAFSAEPGEKFPETKWFRGVKGLEEAKELQKQFDADIFVYFANYGFDDQKGLCHWFEKRGLDQAEVGRCLRVYLKVKIELPLNKDGREAIEPYKINKCPVVIIVQPNGRHARCPIFDWSGNQPDLLSMEDLVAGFRAKSSARYRQ
jgi:hypothetical protein